MENPEPPLGRTRYSRPGGGVYPADESALRDLYRKTDQAGWIWYE